MLSKTVIARYRRIIRAMNESHDPSNGQFASGGGSGEQQAAAKAITVTKGDRKPQKTPLKTVAERPYKYVHREMERAKGTDMPIHDISPEDLISSQDYVTGDSLSRITGDMRRDKPALVVRHGGKLYLEEGNHRAVHALRTGQKLPSKVIDVDADGKISPVARA